MDLKIRWALYFFRQGYRDLATLHVRGFRPAAVYATYVFYQASFADTLQVKRLALISLSLMFVLPPL
jgi:hypothetical protein